MVVVSHFLEHSHMREVKAKRRQNNKAWCKQYITTPGRTSMWQYTLKLCCVRASQLMWTCIMFCDRIWPLKNDLIWIIPVGFTMWCVYIIWMYSVIVQTWVNERMHLGCCSWHCGAWSKKERFNNQTLLGSNAGRVKRFGTSDTSNIWGHSHSRSGVSHTCMLTPLLVVKVYLSHIKGMVR